MNKDKREKLRGNFLKELSNGLPSLEDSRSDVLRDEFTKNGIDIVIDTCCAFDTKVWETGIDQNDNGFKIAEQYDSKKQALIGHKKWINELMKSPNLKITDVLWDLVD
jgi:hypothetical protein